MYTSTRQNEQILDIYGLTVSQSVPPYRLEILVPLYLYRVYRDARQLVHITPKYGFLLMLIKPWILKKVIKSLGRKLLNYTPFLLWILNLHSLFLIFRESSSLSFCRSTEVLSFPKEFVIFQVSTFFLPL